MFTTSSFKNSNSNYEKSFFSIIIPTWNNLQFLKLCIESIRKNSKYNHQIIVHVNEGSDGTLEWVKEQNFDYSYSEQNIGICYALNINRNLVRTNYIVYMNDDMYVCPMWDSEIKKEIDQMDSNLFYFSSTLIEPIDSGNKCVLAPYNFGEDILSFNENELLKQCPNLYKEDWNGASWPPSIVHVDIWDAVGGYSTEFSPGMYSDPDFSMKLLKYGIRTFKGIGKSKVYHFMSKTTGKVKRNDGRKQFIFKWGLSANSFYTQVLKSGTNFIEPLHVNIDKKFPSYSCINKLKILIKLFI
jgi:glycosyltransferase involved in cell wall biosynthesis